MTSQHLYRHILDSITSYTVHNMFIKEFITRHEYWIQRIYASSSTGTFPKDVLVRNDVSERQNLSEPRCLTGIRDEVLVPALCSSTDNPTCTI